MQIFDLDEEQVKQAAEKAFPENYIDLDKTGFFLRDIAEGTIKMKDLSEPIYVSTNYGYVDRIENGNKTRYKVELMMITIKQDAYEVIYDSYGKSFIAYDDNGIQFVRYEDFYEQIKPYLTLIK